jgi:hypothetical protein
MRPELKQICLDKDVERRLGFAPVPRVDFEFSRPVPMTASGRDTFEFEAREMVCLIV